MFNLAYQVGSLNWNGTVISRTDSAAFEKSLDALKSLGVNEVMLSGYTDAEKADFDMFAESKRIGAVLRARGMKAAQHHGVAPTYAPAGTSQDAVIEKLIRSVQYTANLNADVLVLHPARVDLHFTTMDEYLANFDAEIKRLGRKKFMEMCAANLDAAGEAAGKLGVKIAIENADFPFETDITLMRDYLAEIKSPHVGYCLDSGHANYHCPPATQWLDAFGDRMITTHFHDNRGNRDEHRPPGFGTVPWIDLIQGLKKHNYRKTVTFESGPWPGMDQTEGWRNAISFWRTCERYAEQEKQS